MRASFTGQDSGLRVAAAYINDRLNVDESFWRRIRTKPKFDNATISSAEIERRLRTANSTITIQLWKPKPSHADMYKNTIALVDSGHPRKLFYHTKFVDRAVGQKVNTIVHEYVHSVDAFDDGDPGRQMGHGDNSARGKGDTAPYWIGDLAERIYRGAGLFSVGLGSLRIVEGSVADGDIVDEPDEPLGSYEDEAGAVGISPGRSDSRGLLMPLLLLLGGVVGIAAFARRTRR